MQKALPEMHWHVHTPAGRDEIYGGAQQAFAKPVETHWNFDKAELIISLDGDFLDAGPHQAGASRAWIEARRNATRGGKLLPMHAVAPMPTLTYAKADYHAAHRATRPAAAGGIPARRTDRRQPGRRRTGHAMAQRGCDRIGGRARP